MHFLSWKGRSIVWKFYWKKIGHLPVEVPRSWNKFKALVMFVRRDILSNKKTALKFETDFGKALVTSWEHQCDYIDYHTRNKQRKVSSKIVNEDYFLYFLDSGLSKIWFLKILEKNWKHFQSRIFSSQPHRALSDWCPALVRTGGLDWKHIPFPVDQQTWMVLIITLTWKNLFKRITLEGYSKKHQEKNSFHGLSFHVFFCGFSLVDTTPQWPKGHYGSQGDSPAKGFK